jgi:hypothetical protein
MSTYRTTTRTVTNRSSASFTKSNGSQIKSSSKAKSPYKGKSASKGVRASLKSPTKSQKSFAKTDRSKKAGTGGFGKKATTPATGQKKAVQQKTKPKTKPKAKTKPRRRTPTRRRK